MSLVFGSVCSGIEAASVAWSPLGWRAAFFAEIEAFPSAVLAHHYPSGFNSNAMAGDGDAQAAISADVSRCLDSTGAFAANQGGTVVAFHGSQDPDVSGDVTHPLSGDDGFSVSIAFDETQITSQANYSNPKPGDPCHPLAAGARPPSIASPMSVRRLTPRECERLQGFPDEWTAIPGAADGPRYRALGNSFPVPVVRWIGERIAVVHAALSAQEVA